MVANYTVTDEHGATSSSTLTITLTGTNDAPTISVADAVGAVTEDATSPNLTDSGTITFDDVDLTDAHTTSVAAAGTNTLGGILTASVTDTATGAGDGTVTWNYTVANSATQSSGRRSDRERAVHRHYRRRPRWDCIAAHYRDGDRNQ